MSRASRIATAFALILAIAVLPVVLDRCAASCEALDGAAGAAASSPGCHHATTSTSRIGQMPTPCGHDHSGTTGTAAQSVKRAIGSFDSLVTFAEPTTTALPSIASSRHALTHGPPGASATPDARSLPLRI
jgi:hypothetical protein